MIYPSTAEIPAQIRRYFQLPTEPRGVETGSLNIVLISGKPRGTEDTKNELKLRLKGTVSRVGYLFEGLNILISTVCVCADGFQGLSKAFHYPVQLLTYYLLF
jgi:hypothetical protein